jgi:hypothetical protein
VALEPNDRPAALAAGTLSAALAIGAVLGALTADDTAQGWPPQAAQVLVTLMVAAVVEQYTQQRSVIGWVGVALSVVVAIALLVALALCVTASSGSDGFTAFEAGIVNGALGALGVIVVVGLLWRVWPGSS